MRYSADQLARMLAEAGARSGPLHRQLSTGLRQLIELGELPPRAVLPPERALAEALTVSRTTVVTAYQALREDGWLTRRQGSGTTVAPRAGSPRDTVSTSALAGDHTAAQFLNGPLATLDFSTAALPSLPLVAETAGALTERDYAELAAEYHGYQPRGLPVLRQRLASWYTALGIPTTAAEILVTSGAQQALELIAAGCLQEGDEVVHEEPTYRGAIEAFSGAGGRLRAVSALDDRIDQIAGRSPRLIYVQSTVHNPTGTLMPADHRRRLVRLADRHPVVIVDDTSLSGTLIGPDQALPLAAETKSDHVLTVGSMSKLFWGGLRLGWIRGAERAVSRLAQMKGRADFGTSLVSQLISVHLLDRVDEAARIRRRDLSQGLADLTGLLAEHLPDWTWRRPDGGASLWVRLPVGDATHFAQVTLRYGAAILPGAVFSATGAGDDHLRLPYALERPVLRAGVLRLAAAWEAFVGGTPVPYPSVTT